MGEWKTSVQKQLRFLHNQRDMMYVRLNDLEEKVGKIDWATHSGPLGEEAKFWYTIADNRAKAYDKLDADYDKLAEESAVRQQKIDDLSDKLDTLKSDNDALKKQVADYIRMVDSLDEVLARRNNEIKDLKGRVGAYQCEYKLLTESYNALHEKMYGGEAITSKDKEIADLKRQLEEAKEDGRREVSLQKAVVQGQQRDIAELTDLCERYSKVWDDLVSADHHLDTVLAIAADCRVTWQDISGE